MNVSCSSKNSPFRGHSLPYFGPFAKNASVLKALPGKAPPSYSVNSFTVTTWEPG